MENNKGISKTLSIVIIFIITIICFSPWFYFRYIVVLSKDKIIKETNIQRELNGLNDLVENKTLSDAARAKAYDMFKNQYFDHISPDGTTPGKLVQSYGYDYSFEGENLLMGNFSSEKEMVQKWMDSFEHKKNILNKKYKEIGVAVVKEVYNGKIVWIGVQEFGTPSEH
jgi:uncharacterized protein YkwD